MAEETAAGLQASSGELAAARRLDAEDATMRQVLAWAMNHDEVMALRLAVALVPWWLLRGRVAGGRPLLRELAGRADAGGEEWCGAQYWLGVTAVSAGDMDGALGHFTAVRDAAVDRGPSRVLADCLAGRSLVLLNLGRVAEAAGDGRRSLAMARDLAYPDGEVWALGMLSLAANWAGDLDGAVHLARQAGQVQAGISGSAARGRSQVLTIALIETGELAAAERVCAEGLQRSRDAGDLENLTNLLEQMAILDLRAGRAGDAAAHLREQLQIALRAGSGAGLCNGLDCCGHLCAATGRPAEAVTLWAAALAPLSDGGAADPPLFARRRHEPLRAARQALGPARAREAEERGAAMSLATAAEYALMLLDPVPPPAPAAGHGPLSARERELVTLVAQGRTDAQIAARLHISIRTVRSHLDRIRDKTGCRRRADLTRLALSAGLL